jgi:hypothetical protein
MNDNQNPWEASLGQYFPLDTMVVYRLRNGQQFQRVALVNSQVPARFETVTRLPGAKSIIVLAWLGERFTRH